MVRSSSIHFPAVTPVNIRRNYSTHFISFIGQLLLLSSKRFGECRSASATGGDGSGMRFANAQGAQRVRRARLLAAASSLICCLLCVCTPVQAQSPSTQNNLSASELLRRAVDGELKGQADDHTHWMYQVKETHSGKEEVRCVVQTKQGELDRLLLVNGKPLSAEQQKQEDRRIASLLNKPDVTKKRQHAQQKDARQTEDLFRMLPAALTVKYGERKDDLVELLFEPNPNFDPPTREASVFHSMEGRIWISVKEDRLAEIEGHLIREVKFGGGLLGYLDKGGEFHVKQSEISPRHWEISLLHVNMHGKALFFKTISVQQNESRSNFQQVSDNLTLAQAAEELQKQSGVKSAHSDRHDRPVAQPQSSAEATQTSGGVL